MVEFLSLSKYGNIMYNYEAFIDSHGIYSYMGYNNYEDDTTIECSPIMNEGLYGISIWHNNELKNTKSNNLNKLIQSFLYQESTPIIYNWNNAKNKNDNSFTLTFEYFGKEIDISFDKSYTVVQIPDSGLVTVYTDPEYKNCIESYQFTKDGFFCNNILTNFSSSATKDGFGDFKLFKKKEKINNRLLDFLPTLIELSSGDNNKNNIFKISYDDNGIVSKVLSNDKIYSRYECLYEEDKTIIRSVYPNLYDCIDPNYIDFSLTNWSEIEVAIGGGYISITKNVYEIKEKCFNSFLNCLHSNPSIPIINITE